MKLVLIFALGVFVSADVYAAPTHAAVPRPIRSTLNSLGALIVSDFDGNGSMDLATAGASRHEGHGYTQDITVRLNSSASSTIAVHTSGLPLRLRAFDLDGDSDRDLVVEALDREPLAVLLNDGNGHFHEAQLDEFRERLRHRDSHSIERRVSSSDSDEINEDSPSPVASQNGSIFGPDLTRSRLVVEGQRIRTRPGHWNHTSRGPPSLL